MSEESDWKHSGLAIASFVTSLVSLIGVFSVIAIAGVLEATTPGGLDESSIEAVVVGLFIFFFLALLCVALGLGIAGLFQRERKKVLAIIGASMATFGLIGTVFIILIGTMAESG